MKQLTSFAITAIAVILATGCAKELDSYSGTNNICFRQAVKIRTNDVQRDSASVSFAFEDPTVTDSIIKIPVMTMGFPENRDRRYALTINSASTAKEGIHFANLPDSFVMRANMTTDTISLNLHRTPDMLSDTLVLILDLKANENFNTDMQYGIINATTGAIVSYISYKVDVNDVIKKPRRWLDTYFGIFSRTKLFFMCELLDIKASVLDETMTVADAIYFGRMVQRYLNEQKAAGNIIYDEDGTPMSMGVSVQ